MQHYIAIEERVHSRSNECQDWRQLPTRQKQVKQPAKEREVLHGKELARRFAKEEEWNRRFCNIGNLWVASQCRKTRARINERSNLKRLYADEAEAEQPLQHHGEPRI